MRNARFMEEQMVAIIPEADREPVSVVAKRAGSRRSFGGETENARLKKLVAETGSTLRVNDCADRQSEARPFCRRLGQHSGDQWRN